MSQANEKIPWRPADAAPTVDVHEILGLPLSGLVELATYRGDAGPLCCHDGRRLAARLIILAARVPLRRGLAW